MNALEMILGEKKTGRKGKEPLRVLGIDLGTTNSTIAEIVYDPVRRNDVAVRCLAVEQPTEGRSWWNPLVPSIVAIHDGQKIVGEGARRLRSHGQQEQLIEKGSVFASCKNDMGLKLTYDKAPSGYRSAAEISGHILSFLTEAALKDKPQEPARSTVTVPASFQAAQRDDTLKASRLAGLSLKGGDLLDEPVAAFIGYLYEHPDKVLVEPGATRHLLVFDFGGGTCDVAIFRLSTDLIGRLTVASKAVSRYHRLGGGDIDQAILYDKLLPQLLEQNNLGRHDLDFDTKKSIIEPALIAVAESLKIAICEKKSQNPDGDDFIQISPSEYLCKLPEGASLILTNPQLSSSDFDELLVPFLDSDVLMVKETEYRETLSIFAPIQDALSRCGLDEDDIDLCLLVGGSCLIPQVQLELSSFFVNAELLTFADADAIQMAVARGAALNALALALNDRAVIQPVCQEAIALNTSNGLFDLVPKGASLPWPPEGGYRQLKDLSLPESSTDEPLTVRVEVIAREGLGPRPLMTGLWEIPAPVKAGDRIRVECRYDENQVLDVRLSHAERDDVDPFKETMEHPLTHIINPQKVKLRIQKTEEQLRTGEILPAQRKNAVMALAADCAELRYYDKAIARLSELLRQRNEPDPSILNRMALYSGYKGDVSREERLYTEASAADPTWSAPWFNLALLMKKQKRFTEANHAVEMAINLESGEAPYYVLQAEIVRDMDKPFAMPEFLGMAQKCFGPLPKLDKWQLWWYINWAEMEGDATALSAARQERQSRNTGTDWAIQESGGLLPGMVV